MKRSTDGGTKVRTRGRSGGVIVPRALTEWEALDPYDFRLAVWLSTHDADYCERLSQHQMAKVLGMSQERAAKSVARLEGLGIVEVERSTAPFSLTITFDKEAWEAAAIPATRESTSRHTGMSFPPDGNRENTVERTQERTSRAKADASFLAFWQTYPRKTAKRTALQAYERAIRRARAVDALNDHEHAIWKIQNAAESYARASKGVEERFIKHPATWLNGDCWDDEYQSVREINHFPEEV